MERYYFTFASGKGQPFGSGEYIIVFAEDAIEAIKRFNIHYPPSNGSINCEFIYTESEWEEAEKSFPFPPAEVINRPETKDILRELAEQLVDECKTFALDSISLQVKPNGQVLAVAEYKDTDGKQTFTRVTRRDKSKPFIIM